MAEKRMFAKSIIDSDMFLDMPLSTQALYFHLSMRADDDGFINNPKKIQRMICAADEDLRMLISKQYVIPFESGIVVIKHWKIHNYIQGDRYKATIHKQELEQLDVDENKAYTLCIQNVSNMDTQISIDKIRLDKVSIDKGRGEGETTAAMPPKKPFGEFSHVLLTDEQHEKLINEYGESKTDLYILKLDEYIEQKGKKYNNHYLTIKKWIRKDDENNGRNERNGAVQPSVETGEKSKYAVTF
ncbi:MAG: replisome organizer [Oscillospiraceae bacterium]